MVGGGACVGGMHAWRCVAGDVHVSGGACMARGHMAGGHVWHERQPLKRAVCILLEFILVIIKSRLQWFLLFLIRHFCP